MADAVEIAKSDTHCRPIGRRHLPVGKLEPIGEMAEEKDLLVRQRHHRGARLLRDSWSRADTPDATAPAGSRSG